MVTKLRIPGQQILIRPGAGIVRIILRCGFSHYVAAFHGTWLPPRVLRHATAVTSSLPHQ